MSQVDFIYDRQQSHGWMDDIYHSDSANRIQEVKELRKLVEFALDLLSRIIEQINGAELSDKGAKVKILHCFGIIQHYQISENPRIKLAIDKLIQAFKNKYNGLADVRIPTFEKTPICLATATLAHYIETIKDSRNDPIYSEHPPMLKKYGGDSAKGVEMMNGRRVLNSNLESHYLSHLFFNQDKTTPSPDTKNCQKMHRADKLKKIIESMLDVMLGIIEQINSGQLSRDQAKRKIIQCLEIIKHYQIGQNPQIKLMMGKLIRAFKKHFKKNNSDVESVLFDAFTMPNHQINNNLKNAPMGDPITAMFEKTKRKTLSYVHCDYHFWRCLFIENKRKKPSKSGTDASKAPDRNTEFNRQTDIGNIGTIAITA